VPKINTKRVKTRKGAWSNYTLYDQLEIHCSEMFLTGLRVHTFGGILYNEEFEIYYYDREGCVTTKPFNLFDNWGLFTAMLIGFSSLDAQQWGFLPHLEWDKERCPIPIIERASQRNLQLPTLLLRCEKGVSDDLKLERHDVETLVEEGLHLGEKANLFPSNLGDMDCTEPGWARVTLQELMHTRPAVFGRGTPLFRVHQEDREGKRSLIVKISSQATRRSPERLYVRCARKGLAAAKSPSLRSLPVLVGWSQCSRISDGPRGRLSAAGRIERGNHSNRMHQILVFPYYSHIYKLKTEDEFKTGIRDCINCKPYRSPWRIYSYVVW
jgi:hypothetical protein